MFTIQLMSLISSPGWHLAWFHFWALLLLFSLLNELSFEQPKSKCKAKRLGNYAIFDKSIHILIISFLSKETSSSYSHSKEKMMTETSSKLNQTFRMYIPFDFIHSVQRLIWSAKIKLISISTFLCHSSKRLQKQQ